jgi:hypothetical protein
MGRQLGLSVRDHGLGGDAEGGLWNRWKVVEGVCGGSYRCPPEAMAQGVAICRLSFLRVVYSSKPEVPREPGYIIHIKYFCGSTGD